MKTYSQEEFNTVQEINKVIRHHGSDNERPLFQVVWSDDEREMRKGTFAEFLGKIFIRNYIGIKCVPKYGYLPRRWVLERFVPPTNHPNEELPFGWQGTYEPLYVFENQFNALPPRIDVCERLIKISMNPLNPNEIRNILSDMVEEQETQEIDSNREMIEEQGQTDFSYRLKSGGLILNAGDESNGN